MSIFTTGLQFDGLYREGLLDDDVMVMALVGLSLLLLGVFPFAYSFFGTWNGFSFAVAGIFTEAGATAVHFLRRDRRMIQYKILRFLFKRRALPGGSGEFPSVVQQHVGVPTKRFEKYVGDLVRKGCLQWTPEGKLVLMSRGINLVGNEDLAVFFEERSESE